MSVFDYEALDRAEVSRDPCDFFVVPKFVRPDALPDVNRDYPVIDKPGNFEPDALTYGPRFADLLAELDSTLLKDKIAEKFGMDLSENIMQLTVRKYSEASDGNVHNDSKLKLITGLIYFNETWDHPGGRLRMIRDPDNIEDYTAEVAPEGGTLLVFRRSERSFHGFHPVEAERRSLQLHYVHPKRTKIGANKKLGIKKLFKRMMKVRKR